MDMQALLFSTPLYKGLEYPHISESVGAPGTNSPRMTRNETVVTALQDPSFIFREGHLKSGFPGDSNDKESAHKAGDLDLIPRSGRSPGEGKSNPLQSSCLENSMDKGARRATLHGLTKNRPGLSN